MLNVIRGEYLVSRDPDDRMTTVLGSCIAACVYDPEERIGGMNHFLLPEPTEGSSNNVKYGAFLMEVLVNELIKSGACKSRMAAKLFGGSKMNSALGDVGDRNIKFARQYLQREGIMLEYENVGGCVARRVNFAPTTGGVIVKLVTGGTRVDESATIKPKSSSSSVLLF